MDRLSPAIRHLAAFVFVYESASIWLRKSPTLSAIARKYPWAPPCLLGALAIHLYFPTKKKETYVVQ